MVERRKGKGKAQHREVRERWNEGQEERKSGLNEGKDE